MDEPIKAFDLSPEQQNTTALIQRLLGQRMADRYVDFCRLASGALPLRVSSPVAAHALRELESILRQTLEVPMDVALTPTPEQSKRMNDAKEQLRTLNFDMNDIQRAMRELKPKLSHKQQIRMIVTRLGLASDGDIASAWISITDIAAEAHGGRALHHSSVVDDVFRADWQAPFDTLIRGLMIALQGKYAAFMQRINQLVTNPDRSEAVKSFSKEIPGALSLLWHFFNSLDTPDWLPHLAERNLLAAPLSQADGAAADAPLLGQWPAGQYLLRMARLTDAEARALIAEALQNGALSTHPEVQRIGLEILAVLPPREAAQLVGLVEHWLTPDARFIMALGSHDLIKNLAQGGEGEAARRVTQAVFKLFAHDGRLATLFTQHMYEHHLPDAVKAIAPVCTTEAVALIADLLDQALRLDGKVSDDPPHDYSHYASREVSEDGMKHDVVDALVGETVRAAKLAIEADPTCTGEVVSRICSHSPKIFTKIALHVLSFNPGGAPDLALACLAGPDLIEEAWCRVEYGELARAWFPYLSDADQEQILAYVDSVPDKYRDRYHARFEQHNQRPPTQDEERAHDESVVDGLLWRWREALPAARREPLEKVGDPDAWQQGIDEPPEIPVSAPNFSQAPVEDIVVFLDAWRPEPGAQHHTVTALARELQTAAMNSPGLYSERAARFVHLPPVYVRHLLEGLAFAGNNRNDLDWSGALGLIEGVVRTAVPRSLDDMEGDDPDWSWARKTATDLMASGLRHGAKGFRFTDASRVEGLIFELNRTAPRDPNTDNFEDSFRDFPYHAATSTPRGAAVELAVLFVFWIGKDVNSEVGKAPRKALETLPDLRALFETELGDRTPAGRVPRAVMGRYLTWLMYFAEPWLRKYVPVLLPNDDQSLRDATWLAHLGSDSGPIDELAPIMRDCYVDEINRLGKDSEAKDKHHVDNRLAEYLIILYIKSAFSDDVFELFWDLAPIGARQHALWFLGIQLELPTEKLPDAIRARAYSYWDRRLAAARTSATPDTFRVEIGTIGQFFFRTGLPDEWLVDQILTMTEAGFAPSEAYSVMDRLVKISSASPDRAVDALSALVKNPRFDRWIYMTLPAGIRTILVNGLATGTERTTMAATETINYLAALGDGTYLDLIPNSQPLETDP